MNRFLAFRFFLADFCAHTTNYNIYNTKYYLSIRRHSCHLQCTKTNQDIRKVIDVQYSTEFNIGRPANFYDQC